MGMSFGMSIKHIFKANLSLGCVAAADAKQATERSSSDMGDYYLTGQFHWVVRKGDKPALSSMNTKIPNLILPNKSCRWCNEQGLQLPPSKIFPQIKKYWSADQKDPFLRRCYRKGYRHRGDFPCCKLCSSCDRPFLPTWERTGQQKELERCRQ